MTMQSVRLATALVLGMGEIGIFNPLASCFEIHVGVSDRPRGKGKMSHGEKVRATRAVKLELIGEKV